MDFNESLDRPRKAWYFTSGAANLSEHRHALSYVNYISENEDDSQRWIGRTNGSYRESEATFTEGMQFSLFEELYDREQYDEDGDVWDGTEDWTYARDDNMYVGRAGP